LWRASSTRVKPGDNYRVVNSYGNIGACDERLPKQQALVHGPELFDVDMPIGLGFCPDVTVGCGKRHSTSSDVGGVRGKDEGRAEGRRVDLFFPIPFDKELGPPKEVKANLNGNSDRGWGSSFIYCIQQPAGESASATDHLRDEYNATNQLLKGSTGNLLAAEAGIDWEEDFVQALLVNRDDHVAEVEKEPQVNNFLGGPNRLEGFYREPEELEGGQQEDHAFVTFLLWVAQAEEVINVDNKVKSKGGNKALHEIREGAPNEGGPGPAKREAQFKVVEFTNSNCQMTNEVEAEREVTKGMGNVHRARPTIARCAKEDVRDRNQPKSRRRRADIVDGGSLGGWCVSDEPPLAWLAGLGDQGDRVDAARRRRGDGYFNHVALADFIVKVFQEFWLICEGTWVVRQVHGFHSNVFGYYVNAFCEDSSEPNKILSRGRDRGEGVPPLSQAW
jgi:hypothetical protein